MLAGVVRAGNVLIFDYLVKTFIPTTFTQYIVNDDVAAAIKEAKAKIYARDGVRISLARWDVQKVTR